MTSREELNIRNQQAADQRNAELRDKQLQDGSPYRVSVSPWAKDFIRPAKSGELHERQNEKEQMFREFLETRPSLIECSAGKPFAFRASHRNNEIQYLAWALISIKVPQKLFVTLAHFTTTSYWESLKKPHEPGSSERLRVEEQEKDAREGRGGRFLVEGKYLNSLSVKSTVKRLFQERGGLENCRVSLIGPRETYETEERTRAFDLGYLTFDEYLQDPHSPINTPDKIEGARKAGFANYYEWQLDWIENREELPEYSD